MVNITMEWEAFEQLSTDRLYEILRFRQQIFVVEQRSPYSDLDGLDRDALHLLLRADDELAGYLRLVPRPDPAPFVAIGRVAVLAAHRSRGYGRRMMEEALRFCRERCCAAP